MKYIVEDNQLTLNFNGRIDTQASMELEPEIDVLLDQHHPDTVCFDLHDVGYVASAFLRICSKTAKKIGKEKFSIINTSPAIKKIFKIAGLEEALHVL
ncbi:MAG: hypothetical protein A2298_05130 [Gammaproteobacteria bacterium RIFOXYB2_FULL_38_6]|nr:MAG: hypothetical protein A2298_05130 [Gammaproteobacteria bacterium RIFOXYB2_FULL_38_6]